MKYVFMVMLVLGFVLPGNAGQREERLLQGLLGVGAQVLDAQVETSAPAASAPPASSWGAGLAGSLKPVLDEWLEGYKEDGRAYARELSDIAVERVREDPEIQSTLLSVRTLCWCVVVYLSLVTLIMLGCLLYLRRSNARLLAVVEKLRAGGKGE